MPKIRKIQQPSDWDYDPDDEDDGEGGDYSFGGWYPPSSPIRTDKGIKARSQRGAFGTSWWAKRWIAALDRFGWGSRLQRGKTYARQGQVLTIDFAGSKIKAKVQGSRPKPYDVTIEMQPLSAAQWEHVIDALARQAIFAAKLLAGEMPQNIEQAFDAAGVPLFPRGPQDISAACSCPDYANPCKHIAAVYYLLGERFDEDPFLIFQARADYRCPARTPRRRERRGRANRACAGRSGAGAGRPAGDILPGRPRAGHDPGAHRCAGDRSGRAETLRPSPGRYRCRPAGDLPRDHSAGAGARAWRR